MHAPKRSDLGPLSLDALARADILALGGVAPHPARKWISGALILSSGLALRMLVPSLVASLSIANKPVPQVCAVPIGLIAHGRETLGCTSDVPVSSLVPLSPQALRYRSFQRPAPGGQGVFARRSEPMSQPLRLALGLPIDLRQADAATIAFVPGMTPRLAQELVAIRSRSGPIRSYVTLAKVPGFGRRRLQQLARASELGPTPPGPGAQVGLSAREDAK